MSTETANLHVFTNDCEWVIARDAEDVRAVLSGEHGIPYDGNDEAWEQCSDAERLTIHLSADESEVAEPGEEGARPVRKTFREWIEKFGRGYLCTTEA
jgi:hypothetical protein